MTRITEELIRKRAEHNDGVLATLEEVSLHQLNIEKIEGLGQLCKHLRILYLQSNLISKLENIHKLKELEYLNMAVNNLTKVQNLQRCESLQKLDLTVNFLDKAGLLSVQSLQQNEHLSELYLLGNPCAEWSGYRQFVVGTLPQLRKLDGKQIPPSESITARQVLPSLQQLLRKELLDEGIDPDAAAEVEDDSLGSEDIPETGYRDETGEMKRPWCPATRLLEHRETQAQAAEAEARRKAQQKSYCNPDDAKPVLREDFPTILEGEEVRQKNEGQWSFSLLESADGSAVELDVEIGRYMDTSLVKADVQPSFVRLLIRGRLLQLRLPCEVRPDSSKAERSTATGHLLITMPKEDGSSSAGLLAYARPRSGFTGQSEMPTKIQPITIRSTAAPSGSASSMEHTQQQAVQKAVTHCLDSCNDDDDFLPEL
ncbi:hypothetical protein ABBQ38_009495 [Trebouxia sp. C0009 RCD-2024]